MSETHDLTGVSVIPPIRPLVLGERGYSMPFQAPLDQYFASAADCVGRLRFTVGGGKNAKNFVCSSVDGEELHFAPDADVEEWASTNLSFGTLSDDDDLEDELDFNATKVPGFKRILFSFKVLFAGWECDDDAWVVEIEDGSRVIVATSHCATYIAKPKEFEEKIAEYERVAADTRKALAMLST